MIDENRAASRVVLSAFDEDQLIEQVEACREDTGGHRREKAGGDLPSITCFPPLLLKLGENPFGLLLLLFFSPSRRPIAATGEEEAAALFFSLFKVCTGSLCPFCPLFLPLPKRVFSLSSS